MKEIYEAVAKEVGLPVTMVEAIFVHLCTFTDSCLKAREPLVRWKHLGSFQFSYAKAHIDRKADPTTKRLQAIEWRNKSKVSLLRKKKTT